MERIAALYEDDALPPPPAGPAIAGKAAIRERYRQGFEKAKLELRFHSKVWHDTKMGRICLRAGLAGGSSLVSTYRGKSARRGAGRNQKGADEARKRIVLFGGHDGDFVFGDTWEWDGHQWSRVSFVEAQRRVDNGH